MFSTIKSIIFRAPNYWSAFGFIRGTFLLLRLESKGGRRSEKEIRIAIPGSEGAIFLRDRLSDRSIFWQVVVRRQYSLSGFAHAAKVRAKYEQLVAGGVTPLIIDAGGNIGLSARYFAEEFPKAKILVLEPDQDNFEMLKKNTAVFGDRVTPIKGGIWVRNTGLRITNPDGGDSSFRVEEVKDAEDSSIQAYSVDGLLEKYSVQDQEIFMVKLDIEGSQSTLFTEKTEWLQRTAVAYLELDDWLLPWSGSSVSFFKSTSQIKSDYLLSGEHVVWLNHSHF